MSKKRRNSEAPLLAQPSTILAAAEYAERRIWEVMRVVEAFRARVLEVSAESLVIEATGPEDAIDSLLEGVRPYGIIEMTRTGRVAMTRGSAPVFAPETGSSKGAALFWNSDHLSILRNCS